MQARAVGEIAAANGVVLHQLADTSGSLEEAYLQVTQPTVEYRGQR
jgi:ABC-2 type transport system ATP-binding protein